MPLEIVAPWIVESWHDALYALSFDIPKLDLGTYGTQFAVVSASLLLLALTWSNISWLPWRARLPARMLILLALLSPLAILTAIHLDEITKLPKFAGRFREAVPPVDFAIKTQRLPPSVALSETLPSLTPIAKPAALAPALGDTRPADLKVTAVEPNSTAQPQPLPSPTVSANATIRRVTEGLARMVAKAPESTEVQVFFGTDRAASDDKDKLSLRYTAARTGRLELGRATIEIPRAAPGKPPPRAAFKLHALDVQPKDDFLHAAVLRVHSAEHDKEHALVFVPGFNTGFEAALFRAAQLAQDLKFDGPVFVYSWPSAARPAEYAYDRESAALAAPHFAEFLRVISAEAGVKNLSLFAHGLGARLALATLANIKDALAKDARIKNIVLSAPDIERAAFETEVQAIAGLGARITLYAASSDYALNVSRRFAGGVPRAGDVLGSGPLVLAGVETVDVSAPGTDAVGLNHQGYIAQTALIRDLRARLDIAAPPGPDVANQTADAERVATPAGSYLRIR